MSGRRQCNNGELGGVAIEEGGKLIAELERFVVASASIRPYLGRLVRIGVSSVRAMCVSDMICW
jgi:hypothetical protein